MSSRGREPDDEPFADNGDPDIDEVFQDSEVEDIGTVDAEEFEWETDSQSSDDKEDLKCTAALNEVREPQTPTADSGVQPETLARLQDCRPELERVADSDLPAESIAKELLQILNQQERPT